MSCTALISSSSVTPPLLLSLPLSRSCLVSSGIRSLESLCLQVTDLFPGLRRMQSVLPEHGCLLVSPGNYWQNQRELFDSDPDPLKTIQKHEPKGLHTSATLRGSNWESSDSVVASPRVCVCAVGSVYSIANKPFP